jgi:hypothetical protein
LTEKLGPTLLLIFLRASDYFGSSQQATTVMFFCNQRDNAHFPCLFFAKAGFGRKPFQIVLP